MTNDSAPPSIHAYAIPRTNLNREGVPSRCNHAMNAADKDPHGYLPEHEAEMRKRATNKNVCATKVFMYKSPLTSPYLECSMTGWVKSVFTKELNVVIGCSEAALVGCPNTVSAKTCLSRQHIWSLSLSSGFASHVKTDFSHSLCTFAR